MNFARKLNLSSLCCLLLGATMLGATSCASPSINNSNTTGSANSTSAGSAAGIAANENPMDSLTKAMRAQFDAKSYRVRMESSYSERNTTRVIEFAAPDRYHITSDMDETIIIGPTTYRRVNNGPWQKFPVDVGSMVNAFRDPKMIDEVRKSTEVKFLGPDALDGTPTLVYQYTMKDALGTGMTSTSKTWLGAADSLPRRSEVEGEINNQKTRSVITYSDYNADIKIEPPL